MTVSSVATLGAPLATAGRRLSPTAAFLLLASLTVSFLAGSSAPTPLYGVYMAEWGLTPLMITVIFGIYALAVLLALLVAGRLSDHLGRRPVLLAATLAQAVTMILFVTATGLTGLLVARVLQGLTTGAAVGAIGAAMIDLDKTRGTVANAVAPPFGTATGALVAGVLVQYLPFPTHLVYIVFGLVFIVQALGLIFMTYSIALAVVSLPYNAIALFFVGTMIAGVGFGAGFQGAVRTVVPFAAPHERAGVLSIIFIISYIGMGVPAVAAGWLIARHGNILATAQIFGAVIMALACTALPGSVLRAATKRVSAPQH